MNHHWKIQDNKEIDFVKITNFHFIFVGKLVRNNTCK